MADDCNAALHENNFCRQSAKKEKVQLALSFYPSLYALLLWFSNGLSKFTNSRWFNAHGTFRQLKLQSSSLSNRKTDLKVFSYIKHVFLFTNLKNLKHFIHHRQKIDEATRWLP
jgi:hypothetical protein